MEYYDTIAKGYDELHGEEQIKKAKIILQHITINDTDTLLDVGCGTGIASIFPGNITGIDTSKELIKLAQTRIKAQVADAHHLPFPNNSFDIVISLTAAHHFKKKAFKEIQRVAKGTVIITLLKKANNFVDLHNLLHKLFKVKKEIEEDKDIIYFLHT
jgi:ubiquinone/menaquinone biosynthesis C-methylase UbiE